MATRPSRDIPLTLAMVAFPVCIIGLSAGAVGVLSYASTSSIVDDTWRAQSAHISARTTRRALHFLEPAVPAVRVSRDLVNRHVLDTADAEAMLKHMHAVLRANPEFTWYSYGASNGTYLSVYHWEGTVRRTYRTVDGLDEAGVPRTHYRDDELQPNGTWKRIRDDFGSYDPRNRPWYKRGMTAANGGGVWVGPFLFLSRMQPGFTYALSQPATAAGDSPQGVWAVDFEAGYLSIFLSGLSQQMGGMIYLLNESGDVLGHPRSETTAEREGTHEVANAASHPDKVLRRAWTELQRLQGGERRFSFDDYLAIAKPFPADSHVNWMVLTVIPRELVFGRVRHTAERAMYISLLIAVLATLVGWLLARNVSGSLARLAAQMQQVARLDLTQNQQLSSTPIREVNSMNVAVGTMKEGLRSFAKYVPRELVQEVLQTGRGATLGGEVRQLTVLFADVVGFTRLSETLPPDDLVAVLGDYLEQMSEAIASTDGTVDKYIGDAIMAFWGAPSHNEKHAASACHGALEMKRRLSALNAAAAATGAPRLAVRIGINSGDVLVGNIGSPQRMNYTIIGDTVNTASRLEHLNRAHGTDILVGPDTAAAAGDEFVFRRVEKVRVKGKTRALWATELVGLADRLPAEVVAGVARYDEAMQLYLARRFEAARTGFEAARAMLGGEDGPCDVMLTRVEHFLQHPPGDDWHGVHVMTLK